MQFVTLSFSGTFHSTRSDLNLTNSDLIIKKSDLVFPESAIYA